MEAQRVVQAISTILPKIDSRHHALPPRYMREHEASLLASVCEEWLRSVAAEEWPSEMLQALPEVTTACLNALIVAMLNAGQMANSANNPTQQPPPHMQHQSYGSYQQHPSAPQSSYMSPPPPPPPPPQRGSTATGGGTGDMLPPGSWELVDVLKHNFGNRATELLGVMSVTGGSSNSITRSSEKKRFLSSQDLQLGLAQLGFDISIQKLQAILVGTLGKVEPLYLHDFDMLLNLAPNSGGGGSGTGGQFRPSTAPAAAPSHDNNLHSIPSPYTRDERLLQQEMEHHQINLMRTEPVSPRQYQQSVSTIHQPEYDPYGFHLPHHNPYASASPLPPPPPGSSRSYASLLPTHRPVISNRVAAIAGSSSLLDIGGDDTPAPQLATMIAARLKEYGVGLESCFEALNTSGATSGVKPLELMHQLHKVFNIKCPEEVCNRLVAWGDTSGDGRLRYVEFARLMRSATGYEQIQDVEGQPIPQPPSSQNFTYERPGGVGGSVGSTPEPYSDVYGYQPSPSRSGGGGGGGGRRSHKSLIESISETCYFAAQETQSLGGVGMRAVFKSAAAREDGKNASKDNKLSPSALSEYLLARGCSISEGDLQQVMSTYGDGSPMLSFSQFMRMMAVASPARN